MHKGVILLIKTKDKLDAVSNAKEFLEQYEGQIWDWYVIGGRWSGELNAARRDFYRIVKKQFPKDFNKYGTTYNFLENKENQKVFQEIWEGLRQKTVNPYTRDHFIKYTNKALITNRESESFLDDCEDEVYVDDVLPLSDCLETVKDWVQDPVKEGKKLIRSANKWLKGGDYGMYGYLLRCAGGVFSQDFTFDTNVFNVEEYNYSIPEDVTGWFAVMVDMHN